MSRVPRGLVLSLPLGPGTELGVGLNGAGVRQCSTGWPRDFFQGRYQRGQGNLEPAVTPCLPDLKPTGNFFHKCHGFGVSLEGW